MSLTVTPNLVTTIVPIGRRVKDAIASIDSLLQQTYRPIEIVAIKFDGLGDGDTTLKQLVQANQEIRVFHFDGERIAGARETGRLNARGEYVQYLDGGETLKPNKFDVQVAALRKHRDCDIAGVFFADRASVDGTETKLNNDKAAVTGLFPDLLLQRVWSTATPLYRREIIDQAGPWCDLRAGSEWEYEARVAALGASFLIGDQVLCEPRSIMPGSLNTLQEAIDPNTIDHECIAIARLFQHATRYMTLENRAYDISDEYWKRFSDLIFQRARHCARAKHITEARALLSLSIDSLDRRTPQHRSFLKLVSLLGWSRAARLYDGIAGSVTRD